MTMNADTLRADQQLPHRKYLLTYLCATDNEKEKIINMFNKMFKEYTFNHKEEKELILRHIRKTYPSALFLSGKRIDNLLKAYILTNYTNKGRNLVNILKLKDFIKSEKEIFKKNTHGMSQQKEDGDRRAFSKLITKTNNQVPLNKDSRQGHVVHLQTFNLPYRLSAKKIKRNTLSLMSTQRRGKSVGKEIPLIIGSK